MRVSISGRSSGKWSTRPHPTLFLRPTRASLIDRFIHHDLHPSNRPKRRASHVVHKCSTNPSNYVDKWVFQLQQQYSMFCQPSLCQLNWIMYIKASLFNFSLRQLLICQLLFTSTPHLYVNSFLC